MHEEMPLSQARADLGELVNHVLYRNERIVLVRRGKPVAVLVHPDDLALLEQLEDADGIRAARAALEEDGPSIPIEQLLAESG